MEREHAGAGPEATGNQEQNNEHEVHRDQGPRIYVASLSDYNDGRLHGTWIDADQDLDALHADVDAMLARSPTGNAEEVAIHDYEGFGAYHVDEYASLDRLSRIAQGIQEHGLAFAAFAAHCDHGDDALEGFDDVYAGDWPTLDDYAEDLVDSLGLQDVIDKHIPDGMQPYVKIDTKAFVRDLELSGFITAVDHPGGVWIFDGSL